ncbi:hypothetical protein KIW84_023918 [Lathyrus oleraceus]|uniref:Uncharacterized protein n=1 Tax=Pisum sativum TaxID=3888 RepID=A0A9D4YIQ9_PEA|nr:hypothetical protein KIW84_023918 [Pisum sativum]
MIPHNDEELNLIGLDMEQVVTDKLENTMLPAEEDGSQCDTESFDHIKDEKVDLINFEKNNMIVQTSEYETYVEANSYDIVFSMRRKVGGKIIHMDLSSAYMDKVTFHPEISGHKWEYVL